MSVHKSAALLLSSLAEQIAKDPLLSLKWPEETSTVEVVADELNHHAILCLDLDAKSDDIISALAFLCQDPPNPFAGAEDWSFRFQRSLLLARALGCMVETRHTTPEALERGRDLWSELQRIHKENNPALAQRLEGDLDEEWGKVPSALQAKLRELNYSVSQDPQNLAQVALRALDDYA